MVKVGPDVRVKLSAEGVQEVVNAFKRIQQEADRTAAHSRTAGEGQAFLNKQLSGLKDLLPALGVAAIVAGFVSLAKSGLELADSIGKLQQKTGITTDTLSAFSFAARYADVEQEALAKGMVKFARSMDDYDKGAAKARDAIRGLFGNENALQGLSMDQRLQKITEKLASMEPGAKRTGAAIALFGKAGAELLPVLDEVGTQGLDALRKRAEALGLSFNEDAVRAAENLKRSMITLKAEAQGMATQFLMGFAPELASALEKITDETSGTATNGFAEMGKFAGHIIDAIVAAFVVAGKAVAFVIREAELAWDDFGGYAKDTFKDVWLAGRMWLGQMFTGNMFALASPEEMAAHKSALVDRFNTFLADAEKSIFEIFADKPLPKSKKKGDKGSSENEAAADAAQKAALTLAQAEADARLKVLSAQQKQQEAAELETYNKGLESLRQYYANRLKIAEEMGQAEIAAAQARLDAITKTGPMKGEQPAAYQARVVAAQADVDAKKIEVQTTINGLRAEEAKAAADLQQKELQFQQKIQQAQGDRFTQARAGIAAEAAQLDVLLRKMGVADVERTKRVAAFIGAGNQQIDFSQLQDQAQRAMDEIAAARQQVDLKVQGGLLFAFQGEQQIMQLEKDRLPLLQQIADAMMAAAKASGIPEQIAAAREFQAQLEQLAVSSNKAALEMGQFKQNVEGALTSDLTEFFSNGITQAESFGDAMRGLALSVVQSLQKIAAQMLATYMIQKLLGFFGAASGGASAGSGGGGHARGGLIRGPGTATSDSIPARLSNWEYVVRAPVVKQPGMLEHLDELNFGTPAVRRRGGYRFAEGGLVDVQAGGGGRAALEATLGLDEGLLLRRLEASPEFDRVLVRRAGANRKAFNSVLGR